MRLRIIDKSGRVVLDMPGLGPIFLAQLPDGAYTIEAEREGRMQTRSAEISHSQARAKVAFVWP